MAAPLSYPSCSYCDLSADPSDTHCMGCGGSLGHDEDQNDSNDALLALVTQVNAVVASKTQGLFGTHRELKLNVAKGALCTLWMFSCLIVVNMQSFDSMVFGGDTTVAVRMIDEANVAILEPSLQAAVEGR